MNEHIRMPSTLSSELLQRFASIVGMKNAITDPEAQYPYIHEQRDMWACTSPLVLRPGSVAEVGEIVKLASETGTPLVPQGGNTGLVGGGVPHHNEVVLSLNRLDNIREVDPVSNTITVEAGVTLQRTREAAAAVDRLYPQLLPSEGSCTIGGNLSTNAGGTAALAHGIARSHALGLEVVLADGRVMNALNKLKKDNTGYDLRDLFIGAEGTLGIITAAVLRLVPKPRAVETAFVGLQSPESALKLLTLAQERTAGGVTSFELMLRDGIETVIKFGPNLRDPLTTPHPWYVLLELSSQARSGLRDTMEEILAEGLEQNLVDDATIADTLEQFGELIRHLGGSIKHDVSVPVASVPAFIAEANAAVIKLIPGARPMPFGHLGDGNIHYNITQPEGADKAAFMARWDEVNAVVFDIVAKYHGSISAEHGVGIVKRDWLPKVKDPVALDLMRTLKRTLDPKGILNPGVVL